MIDFTYGSYRKLLAGLMERGIHVGSFRDTGKQPRYVILRHDIDFMPVKALEMGRIDAEAGCSATFFVLLTSPYYNALSADSVASLRSIAALGHEIGLHVDFTGYDLLGSDQQQSMVARLAAALGDATGQAICAVAQHKPAKTGFRVECPGFRDAYEDRYFREIGYLSDSRKHFREEDLFAFFERTPRSQMLIHPIWWTETPMSREEIFRQMAAETDRYLKRALLQEERAIAAWLAARHPVSPSLPG